MFKTATTTTALRDTVAIGTGMVVKLFNSNNEVVDTLTVVIMGDLSGDGKVNTSDLTMMSGNIGGTRVLTAAQAEAANLAQPTRPAINTSDYTILKGVISGTRTITQR